VQYAFIFHMIGPTDLLHPSPASQFKTFQVFVSRESIKVFVSVFGKTLSRKSKSVVDFPFAFDITEQWPLKPLLAGLLLYDHEPDRAEVHKSWALNRRGDYLFCMVLPKFLVPQGESCFMPSFWRLQF